MFQVLNLRATAVRVMKKLGEIDPLELPPFIVPLRNLVVKVTTLYNDIKTDVMNFYNVSI